MSQPQETGGLGAAEASLSSRFMHALCHGTVFTVFIAHFGTMSNLACFSDIIFQYMVEML